MTYVLVDFISDSKSRGILYNNSQFQNIEGLKYSCFFDVEKRAEIIRAAISAFILNVKKSIYGYLGHDNDSIDSVIGLEIKTQGWVFVRRFDYEKITKYEKDRIENNKVNIVDIGNDWVMVKSIIDGFSEDTYIEKIAKNIIKDVAKDVFIFAIYKPIELKKSKFAQDWEKL